MGEGVLEDLSHLISDRWCKLDSRSLMGMQYGASNPDLMVNDAHNQCLTQTIGSNAKGSDLIHEPVSPDLIEAVHVTIHDT